MIIRVLNNLTINAPKTYLSTGISAGAGTLPVKNLTGFQASWAVQIGETGENQTEVLLLSGQTPVGTSGALAATTSYDHPADTPIYAIKYDQAVYERSATGTAGTASPIANGTVTIQGNSINTIFDDTTGVSTYAYRTYFQNSALNILTTESDWITTAGFSFYSLGKMRQRVLDKLVSAGFINGININNDMVNDWMNEWLESMTNAAIAVNEAYQIGTMQVSYIGTQELGTITATDFKQLHRVWYVDASGTYQASKTESNSFSPTKLFSSSYPYFYMQGDSVIGRKPSDNGDGTFIIEYYKLSPVLVEDTDTIPVNMQGYTKSFIDYGHAQALFKDQKIQEATLKVQEAMAGRELFKKEIAPRNKTGATYIDIVEEVSTDQGWWAY